MSETTNNTTAVRRPQRRRDRLDRQLSRAVDERRERGIRRDAIDRAVEHVGDAWVEQALDEPRPLGTTCLTAARDAHGAASDALITLAATGARRARHALARRAGDYELSRLRERPDRRDPKAIRTAAATVGIAEVAAALRSPVPFTRSCMDHARASGPLTETGYAWIELAAAGATHVRSAIPAQALPGVRFGHNRDARLVFRHGTRAGQTAFQAQLAQIRKRLSSPDLATA